MSARIIQANKEVKEKIRKQVLRKRLTEYYRQGKKQIVAECNGDSLDLYISDHFVDRIVERKLEDNAVVINNMIQYFMRTIFYGTKQDNKSFIIKIKNLGIAFAINDGDISKHRQVIVKTIYDIDKDSWFCDEEIELKPTNLIRG
ncbi:MAG: hypothetical protein WC679_02650 [Bacteroidales bacterium]|jgi:hypothetical protein